MTTPDIYEQLTPVLDGIVIQGWNHFTFHGVPVAVPPGPVQPVASAPSHPLPQVPLVRELQNMLYNFAYARPFSDRAWESPPAPAIPDPAFLQRVSQSNRSRPRWDGGWRAYSQGANGEIYVQKGERQRAAMPGEYLNFAGVVQLWVQAENFTAQPGFYYAYSETPSDAWDEYQLVRYYFHSTAASAPAVVGWVTSAMNQFQIPFRMKTLSEAAYYNRTDATVLYLARRYHDIVASLIEEMPAEVGEGLGHTTPLYTHPLRPGAGTAEEPGTGESFGMHRSRLVAEGISAAWMRGTQDRVNRLNAIAACFAREGLDLARPHLNAGSKDYTHAS